MVNINFNYFDLYIFIVKIIKNDHPMKKIKKQNKKVKTELSFVKEAQKEALKNQEIIQDFLNDFMNSPAMQKIREAFGIMNESQKAMSEVTKSNTELSPAIPPLEKRVDCLMRKLFEEMLDKYFSNDKIKSEIRKKIAHCRFCGTPVMHVEDLSHFIKATIKCTNPNCKKIIRIPQDLTFENIIK